MARRAAGRRNQAGRSVNRWKCKAQSEGNPERRKADYAPAGEEEDHHDANHAAHNHLDLADVCDTDTTANQTRIGLKLDSNAQIGSNRNRNRNLEARERASRWATEGDSEE